MDLSLSGFRETVWSKLSMESKMGKAYRGTEKWLHMGRIAGKHAKAGVEEVAVVDNWKETHPYC